MQKVYGNSISVTLMQKVNGNSISFTLMQKGNGNKISVTFFFTKINKIIKRIGNFS